MDKFLRTMTNLKTLFIRVVEMGFVFVALIVLVFLLLGEDAGDYVNSVVTNILFMIKAITPPAMVAVALSLAILYLINRRK